MTHPSTKTLRLIILISLPSACLLVATPASAAKCAKIFGDHMVLQRGLPVPVWGTGTPSEVVKVNFAGQSVSVAVGKNRKWNLTLTPFEASCEGREMSVISKSADGRERKKVFKDVLVGEVWFCSGQSNMVRPIPTSAKNPEKELAAANYPLIRQNKNTWVPCSPQSAVDFSGTAYFFGRGLFKELKVPIGLINRSANGTPIEYWMPEKALLTVPAAKKIYEQCNTPEVLDQLKEYTIAARKFKAYQRAKAAGEKIGEAPPRPRPKNLVSMALLYGKGKPGMLFRRNVAPVIPYAIRGAIWYQGERNTRDQDGPKNYRDLLPAMIKSWRQLWSEGDFPFLYVQLPNYSFSSWPLMRESMLFALRTPKTGMAVTIDIGEENELHPRNKEEVGKRLALLALKDVYSKSIVAWSPLFKSLEIAGSEAIVSMKNIGGGLVLKTNGDSGFEIAGTDRKFKAARVKLQDDKIILSSEEVKKPVAVRYAWKPNPVVTLYNKESLPASPFRSDDW